MDSDKLFKALSNPIRRLMLDELSDRNEQTFFELCSRLIMNHNVGISRQALARHLELLEDAGLVSSQKKGKFRIIQFIQTPIENLADRWLN